jgi:hypothetical protein
LAIKRQITMAARPGVPTEHHLETSFSSEHQLEIIHSQDSTAALVGISIQRNTGCHPDAAFAGRVPPRNGAGLVGRRLGNFGALAHAG